MDIARWKVVLLDVDGTLLDSNDAHAHAWVQALAAHGHPVAFAQVRPLIGKGGDKLLQEVVALDAESPEGERINAARREIIGRRFLASLRPTRGARALLERLRADGIALAVATSSGGEELGGLLRQAGIDDLIKTAANADDADASKPDPDIVAAALKKAGVAPTEALMLGDTPYDIEAARRAGVECVVLRCGGGWHDRDLQGALAIFDDPADVLAHLDRAPG